MNNSRKMHIIGVTVCPRTAQARFTGPILHHPITCLLCIAMDHLVFQPLGKEQGTCECDFVPVEPPILGG